MDYSAVTAACMMMKRPLFEQLGGFEEKLSVAFNDVDLCLRTVEAGYLVVYNPHVEMPVSYTHLCHDHWRAISLNYAKAPYFKMYAEHMEEVYHRCEKETHLSRINYLFLTELCGLLDIHTKITWSSDYELVDGKTERLVGLCQSAGGSEYLSGPAAKDYIVDSLFEEAGITLKYMDYSGYPEYHQMFGPFEHGVTVLDLLFNEGPKAREFMKS